MTDRFAAFQQLLSQSRGGCHPALAIVVAHPDDEVIGAGAQLPRWTQAQVIHVTDGAPRNMADALAVGFRTREEYALARRKELESALALAGFLPDQLHSLGCVDQKAAWHLNELVVALAKQLRAFQPELVLTHPYEGGHPDHDATAFVVHNACQWLQAQHGCAPVIIEMTSYHNRAGRMSAGEFLPNTKDDITTLTLTPEQAEFKRRLYACFATQRKVLEGFPIDTERFRLAPRYDFGRPPHAGRLYYEMFDWGLTKECWCQLARVALAAPHISRPAYGSHST